MSLHVTTFYSFKGGVGRTQALVNAAAWIATKQPPSPGGRPRVIMVDFDLEASGIQYVEGLHVAAPKPGIVDFIHDYLDHAGEVPDIANYVTQALLPNGAQVDVILAGDQSRYHRRFGQLRFDALWQRQHGHDLFLDMKCQLEELGYEFMLVDSRTGLCDTSELCTLILPDQVVVVCAPNRQNLAGTRLVIERIRQNPTTDIVGVASRVRMTDDEQGALRAIMSELRQLFQQGQPAPTVEKRNAKTASSLLVVHEDPQQRVLADSIAVISYPRSGLAKEYRRVARRIVAQNPHSPHWVSVIAKDALTAERLTRRYGIPVEGVAKWRKLATSAALGDPASLWELAKGSPVDPRGSSDGRYRMLDVDLVTGLTAIIGPRNPPPEAIRWILEGLESGEIEGRIMEVFFKSDSTREILPSAIERTLAAADSENATRDAIRFSIWTNSLHNLLVHDSVRNSLHSPDCYMEGGCFGGFRGSAATSYIMRCGDMAGVDWDRIAANEGCRRWVRAAALDDGRVDLASRLIAPVPTELKYFSHWLAWAIDVLAIPEGSGRGSRQRRLDEIRGHSLMIQELQDFWLPGVEAVYPDVIDDSINIERVVLAEQRGRRPQSGTAPFWLQGAASTDGQWDLPDFSHSEIEPHDNPGPMSHSVVSERLIAWYGLTPSACAVLRSLGLEEAAGAIERDAIERLDADGFNRIVEGLRRHRSRDGLRPLLESEYRDLHRDASERVTSFPYTARMFSPVHRSAIDIAELYACLKGEGFLEPPTALATFYCSAPMPRFVYSRIAPLGTVGREWGGWSSKGPGHSCIW